MIITTQVIDNDKRKNKVKAPIQNRERECMR